jgi:hypothetical protein
MREGVTASRHLPPHNQRLTLLVLKELAHLVLEKFGWSGGNSKGCSKSGGGKNNRQAIEKQLAIRMTPAKACHIDLPIEGGWGDMIRRATYWQNLRKIEN